MKSLFILTALAGAALATLTRQEFDEANRYCFHWHKDSCRSKLRRCQAENTRHHHDHFKCAVITAPECFGDWIYQTETQLQRCERNLVDCGTSFEWTSKNNERHTLSRPAFFRECMLDDVRDWSIADWYREYNQTKVIYEDCVDRQDPDCDRAIASNAEVPRNCIDPICEYAVTGSCWGTRKDKQFFRKCRDIGEQELRYDAANVSGILISGINQTHAEKIANETCVLWDTGNCTEVAKQCLEQEGNLAECIIKDNCDFYSAGQVTRHEERLCLRNLRTCWPQFKENPESLERCILGETITTPPVKEDSRIEEEIEKNNIRTLVCLDTEEQLCKDTKKGCKDFSTLYDCLEDKLTHRLENCVPPAKDPCAKAAEDCWHLMGVERAFAYCMEERTAQYSGEDQHPDSAKILAHQNILYLVGNSLNGWEHLYNDSTYDRLAKARTHVKHEPQVKDNKNEENQ